LITQLPQDRRAGVKKIVFDGPESFLPIQHSRYGLVVFTQGVPREVGDDLAEEMMKLNPRNLPIDRLDGDDGPVASDYGMKVFRVLISDLKGGEV
jgi:hypothetical protein